MARKKTESLHVRISKQERRTLKQIMESAECSDESEAIRFCIFFARMLLSAVPAYAAEALIASDAEEDPAQQEDT